MNFAVLMNHTPSDGADVYGVGNKWFTAERTHKMVFRSFEDFQVESACVQIAADANLGLACDMMADAGVDALTVEGAEEMCGVITEFDILRHVSQNGGLAGLRVADLMRTRA